MRMQIQIVLTMSIRVWLCWCVLPFLINRLASVVGHDAFWNDRYNDRCHESPTSVVGHDAFWNDRYNDRCHESPTHSGMIDTMTGATNLQQLKKSCLKSSQTMRGWGLEPNRTSSDRHNLGAIALNCIYSLELTDNILFPQPRAKKMTCY